MSKMIVVEATWKSRHEVWVDNDFNENDPTQDLPDNAENNFDPDAAWYHGWEAI